MACGIQVSKLRLLTSGWLGKSHSYTSKVSLSLSHQRSPPLPTKRGRGIGYKPLSIPNHTGEFSKPLLYQIKLSSGDSALCCVPEAHLQILLNIAWKSTKTENRGKAHPGSHECEMLAHPSHYQNLHSNYSLLPARGLAKSQEKSWAFCDKSRLWLQGYTEESTRELHPWGAFSPLKLTAKVPLTSPRLTVCTGSQRRPSSCEQTTFASLVCRAGPSSLHGCAVSLSGSRCPFFPLFHMKLISKSVSGQESLKPLAGILNGRSERPWEICQALLWPDVSQDGRKVGVTEEKLIHLSLLDLEPKVTHKVYGSEQTPKPLKYSDGQVP